MRAGALAGTVAATAATLAASGAHASEAVDTQVWSAAAVTAEATPGTRGLSLWFDGHMRRGDVATTWILRPGLGLRLSGDLSLWAGYALIPTLRDDTEFSAEHRAWQQFSAQHRFGSGVSLQSRTRFEQRVRPDGDDVGARARQLARIGYEFGTPSRVGLVGWNELFVHLNDTDWGAETGLDQNRLFAGVSVRASDRTRVELGYLNVWIERGDVDGWTHAFSATVFAAFKRDAAPPPSEVDEASLSPAQR